MDRNTGRSADDHSRADKPALTRREYVATLASATGGAVAVGASSGVASASHADVKPDHVTISNDSDWLNYYRPILDLRNVPYENHPTLRGWRFTSPEYELDVGVYAAEYAVQRDSFTFTSHSGDHEWVYVFVDSDTGEVDHIAYSAYHWLQGYLTDPNLYTDDGGEHPTVKVANTYHNHIPQASARSSSVLLDVKTLGDPESRSGPFYWWLDNGMESVLGRGTVHIPWRLSKNGTVTDWWGDQRWGTINYYLVEARRIAGIAGAEAADAGDRNL